MSSEGPLVSTVDGAGLSLVAFGVVFAANTAPAPNKAAMNPA